MTGDIGSCGGSRSSIKQPSKWGIRRAKLNMLLEMKASETSSPLSLHSMCLPLIFKPQKTQVSPWLPPRDLRVSARLKPHQAPHLFFVLPPPVYSGGTSGLQNPHRHSLKRLLLSSCHNLSKKARLSPSAVVVHSEYLCWVMIVFTQLFLLSGQVQAAVII